MSGEHSPPTMQDVQEANDAARKEARTADQRAALASRTINRIVQRNSKLYSLVGIGFSVALSLLVGVIGLQNSSEIAAAEVLRAQSEQETDAALSALDQANDQLLKRGQPTVPSPAPDDPANAVTSAVTAQVLAQLPPAPTAQQVAAIIGPAAATQITGPTVDQLSSRVADYFSQNADRLRGPQGDQGDQGVKGDRGPGPTAEQIQAEVRVYMSANPPAPGRDGTNGTNGRDGPAGVSFVGLEFRRDDAGMCMAVVTLSNGTQQAQPMRDVLCEPDLQQPEPDPMSEAPTTTN